MKHLKVFETVAAFEAAKEQLESPYVALTEDNEKVQYEKSEEPQPTYEYVDLGLPSGLKWATMNVGATSETDLGTLYAWGETETKDDFTNENYKYGEPYNTYYWQGTKYCQADGLTTLEQQDDAAHVQVAENLPVQSIAAFHQVHPQSCPPACVTGLPPGLLYWLPVAGFAASPEYSDPGHQSHWHVPVPESV